MRDLPGVTVEVTEHARIPAVERLGRLSRDLGARVPGRLDHVVHLVARPDVVRQRDPAPGGAVVGDARVGRELLAPPEDEDDPVGLEERRLLNVERDLPAERLVEGNGARIVRDPERDQADALLHARNLASTGFSIRTIGTGAPPVASSSRSIARNP